MQHKAFESENSVNSAENYSGKNLHSNQAVASLASSEYHRKRGEKKQFGPVYDSKLINQRASISTTNRKRQKRKRIVLLDSDSD